MPEGPSIAILKEEASPFIGKKVLQVSGNSKLDIQRIKGQKILDMKTWGKHFLLCFKGFTVRIHLMMFGSYRVNDKKENTPRLSLKFKKGELNFYTCSVKFIEEDLDDIYDWEADIMSPLWNNKKTVTSIKAAGKVPVCDILLDQQIFSGSGNIIKNEVLHITRLHPLCKPANLPARKINDLVKATHKYAFQFYEWKNKYELKKHWQVYTKKTCPRCHIPLMYKYLGKTNRRTFYCWHCQLKYKNGAALKAKMER